MHKAVSLFTLVVAAIIGTWWWLGSAVPMPASPLDPGEKLYCISYAPFRGSQTPLDLGTKIDARQIDEDLARLAKITDCVRIYSVDFGLEQVPEIAGRHGLKVLLGLWVSGHADRTKYQIDTGIALAKKFPNVIRAVIVGNEALLRGEIAPEALANLLRTVKSQVTMPVSYADVWEFWVRYRELASAVDFVTVHILPYWEDHPIAAAEAANHVDSIRKQVVAQFAGKEIVIGEVGWPSAGRMRDGALPSPANQARVLHDLLQRGKRENFRMNIIEAFDQPWKRFLEGTVGGHWGVITDPPRELKFVWGQPVSNHPHWRWQAAGGVAFAALIFGAALVGRRRLGSSVEMGLDQWLAIAVMSVVSGVLIGWTIELIPIESLGAGGWIRSLALAAVAVAAPVGCAMALAGNIAAPAFVRLIGQREARAHGMQCALGWILLLLCVLTVQATLAIAFDPRYRDFPFAPLTGAVVPFLLVAYLVPQARGKRSAAETTAAVVIAACAIAILIKEGLSNWQSIWLCAAAIAFALTLVRARFAPD